MRFSGLTGNMSSLVFGVGQALAIVLFIVSVGGLTNEGAPQYRFAAMSILVGATGLLVFTNMFSQAQHGDVGRLIVLTTLVQVMIPILYQMFVVGDQSLRRIAGVLCALVAIVLLS